MRYPRFSPDGSRIAFTTRSAAPDGDLRDERRRPEPDPDRPTTASTTSTGSFSPDGSKIVFIGGRSPDDDVIWVMSADGQNQCELTMNPARGRHPELVPRRPENRVPRGTAQRRQIWVMNADGENQTPLIDDPSERTPAFSPDGRRSCSAASLGGNLQIFVMSADGLGRGPLTRRDGERDSGPTGSRSTRPRSMSPPASRSRQRR